MQIIFLIDTFKKIYYILLFSFQKLQNKVDQMLLGQSDSTKKLLKTQDMFDKVSQDNKKKSDQIDKYQRDVKYMEDRIRNLEIRGNRHETMLTFRPSFFVGIRTLLSYRLA